MADQVLDIDCLPLGAFQTNCYVIRPAGLSDCWVIDPGLDPQPLLDRLQASGVNVVRILLTHGHYDHIAGIEAVKEMFPQAVITASQADAGMHTDPYKNLSGPFGWPMTAPPAEQTVQPGEELTLGSTVWRVLDTAGHTPGGVSFYCPAGNVVLVGDALFAGSVGRCDLPGASMPQLIGNITRNLLTLPPATRVLPGHGPETTIGEEAATNPCVGG